MRGCTSLYRHYDADGLLLYVGISASHARRLAQHEESAHWFDHVAHIDVEYHSTREEAIKAEIQAIKSEVPKFNSTHSPIKNPASNIVSPVFSLNDAITEMQLDCVGGFLPSDLAQDVQELIDHYERKARELADERRSAAA